MNSAYFFLLTILFLVLTIMDRKTDNERFEQDESEMNDQMLQDEIKQNSLRSYYDTLKKKKDQAKETYNGAKETY